MSGSETPGQTQGQAPAPGQGRAPVGRPGRYQRSTGGLVGAMIILVAFVLVFVGFRALFRQQPDYAPTKVDYLATVQALQQAGTPVVYPASLPSGWFAKDVHLEPGDRPAFDLALTTGDQTFAGLHVGYDSLDDDLSTYVDESPTKGRPLQVSGTVASEVAPTWQSWSDAGGDHAYSAQIGSGLRTRTVLVYGSASPEQLQALLSRLTTAKVTGHDG